MSSIQTERKSNANIKEIPLRTIVILPFLLQVVVVIGITGCWSLRNREIVIDLVGQLQREVGDRPQTHRQVNVQIIDSSPTLVARVGLSASLDGQEAYLRNDLEMHLSGLPLQTPINNCFDRFRFKADRLKKLFRVSPAQTKEGWHGFATLSRTQNLRDGSAYSKQQDERYIPFASKLRDSVQKFLELAIAPLVARNLYPERSL